MPRTEPAYVVALSSFMGGIGSRDIRITTGDIYRADDPAVKKWPYAFGPLQVHESSPSTRVEQATAAPGEKRGA